MVKLDSTYALVHHRLGVAYAAKRDIDKAMQEYRMEIKYHPNTLASHKELADELIRNDFYQEAAEEYLEVLKLDSTNVRALYYLGSAYFLNEYSDKALEIWGKVVDTYPTSSYARKANENMKLLLNSQQ